jgi:hypothetical protein
MRQIPKELFMNMKKSLFTGTRKCCPAGATLALLVAASGACHADASPGGTNAERQATMQSIFYCNVKALNSTERAHHKELTEKLIAARKEIVETGKGYEFQYDPATISLAELADWVGQEGKCCPFFDFHIDLEQQGRLLCLRLAGEEGIKAFIRAEFQVPAR